MRALLTPVRAAAVLGLLASVLLVQGLTTASTFGIHRIDVDTVRWTDREQLLRWLDVSEGANAFALPTGSLAERLELLPSVASASVEVSLPDALVVHVVERTAIIAWRVGDAYYLVDRDGFLFELTTADVVAADHLPVIADSRSGSRVVLTVGTRLEPADLDAATRLASLVPEDVGSRATRLQVGVSDGEGFTLTTTPRSWTAVFGIYRPGLRSPELVPGQVRLLRSLLFGREDRVARVILADEVNGTCVAASGADSCVPVASPG
jgi:hypothetical protein